MTPLILAVALGAFSGQAKRTMTPADYGQWQRISAPQISPDGRWFACSISLVDGDGWEQLRSVDGPQKVDLPLGSRGEFSDDSKWFACMVGTPKKDAEALASQHKPIPSSIRLRSLSNNFETTLPQASGFRFLKGGQYLVVTRTRTEPTSGSPGDLYVLNLNNLADVTIGNVADYALNKSETLIAAHVVGPEGESGIQIYDPASTSLHNLRWSTGKIAAMAWATQADVLAFLEGTKDDKKDGDWNALYVATNVRSPQATISGFATAAGKDLPAGTRIAEFGGLGLNADGSAVAFGVRPWEDAKKPPTNPADKPGVDIWNSADLRIQPLQQREAQQDIHRVEPCVWRPGVSAMVRLSDDPMRQVGVLKGVQHAIEQDLKPYQSSVTSGFEYYDLYVIDTTTGKRTLVAKKLHDAPSPSPDSRYIAYYTNKNWSVFDFTTGKSTVVTAGMGSRFEAADDDHTVPEKPPVAAPAWLARDAGAFFYEAKDAYLWTPSATKLTDVNATNDRTLRCRLIDTGDNEDGVLLDKPMYFGLFDPITKESGYYLRQPDGTGKELVLDNKSISGILKAKAADRIVFTMGSFVDSPNAYVTNGLFTQAKPITRTNPQQDKFLWGRSELVKYKSRAGDALEGELIYPADYVKGRKYPMIVYVYEKLSDSLNAYAMPSVQSPYSAQAFSQNGYFVFEPDIVYHGRQPGISAQGCIEPAVAAVLAKGDVDSARIGMAGHSWGGYETAYMSTHSHVFAAYVAGAPLTNLVSMYGSIYWNSGTPDQEILETSQGRLQVPFWEDLKTYEANSALYNVQNNQAPLLLECGTVDGAVDWHQSQEMYIAMRRAGKKVVMLVYEGENHGLARKPNILDYRDKLQHFFDVYLKGASPEPWLSTGIPFLKKG